MKYYLITRNSYSSQKSSMLKKDDKIVNTPQVWGGSFFVRKCSNSNEILNLIHANINGSLEMSSDQVFELLTEALNNRLNVSLNYLSSFYQKEMQDLSPEQKDQLLVMAIHKGAIQFIKPLFDLGARVNNINDAKALVRKNHLNN